MRRTHGRRFLALSSKRPGEIGEDNIIVVNVGLGRVHADRNSSDFVVGESESERYVAHFVVDGDGEAMCSSGSIVKGQMFAASVGGARTKQFWRCVRDSEVTYGMLLGMMSLDTQPVSGMKSARERGLVNMAPNRRSGRHGEQSEIKIFVVFSTHSAERTQVLQFFGPGWVRLSTCPC